MKEIEIDNKKYKASCVAWTKFLYKKIFGTDILADLSKLNEINDKVEIINKEAEEKKMSDEEKNAKINKVYGNEAGDIVQVAFQIAYAEILTEDSKFMSFEDWLKSIEHIDLGGSWILEVIQIASDCFRG